MAIWQDYYRTIQTNARLMLERANRPTQSAPRRGVPTTSARNGEPDELEQGVRSTHGSDGSTQQTDGARTYMQNSAWSKFTDKVTNSKRYRFTYDWGAADFNGHEPISAEPWKREFANWEEYNSAYTHWQQSVQLWAERQQTRLTHLSTRKWGEYYMRKPFAVPRTPFNLAPSDLECHEASMDGGAQAVAYMISCHAPEMKIALVVAANAGRPGGALGCGKDIFQDKIHEGHTTQEEDIVFARIAGEGDRYSYPTCKAIFGIIAKKWGFQDTGTMSTTLTIQGADYAHDYDPAVYRDAWCVSDAILMTKQTPKRHLIKGSCVRQQKNVESEKVKTDLIFVSGPCVRQGSTPTGAKARAFNKTAHDEHMLRLA